MTEHDQGEYAYKNGYAKGYEDGKKASEKRGHWIIHFTGIGQNMRIWAECSECHVAGSSEWKRCPMCEAKMHLEVELDGK